MVRPISIGFSMHPIEYLCFLYYNPRMGLVACSLLRKSPVRSALTVLRRYGGDPCLRERLNNEGYYAIMTGAPILRQRSHRRSTEGSTSGYGRLTCCRTAFRKVLGLKRLLRSTGCSSSSPFATEASHRERDARFLAIAASHACGVSGPSHLRDLIGQDRNIPSRW